MPHASVLPQPSPVEPHVMPWAAQVLGEQVAVPHLPGVPPPPHVVPVGHVPQLKMLPQPSPVEPQV